MGASCALGWPVRLEEKRKGGKKITKAFWRTDVTEPEVKLFYGFNLDDFKVRPCDWRTVFVTMLLMLLVLLLVRHLP